jgi:succinoglycan biosynthesis transport protein ExoP
VALVYANQTEKIKVIAITSALPGEGKTTTAACLAVTMAMTGESVIVVDCDLRRRALDGLFGFSSEKGLVEVLEGTATLEEAIVTDETTGLKLLPLSNRPPSGKDLFSSDAMDKLLDRLRKKFDMIVLDTAPILPVVDTRILARKADVVALLVRWRHTPTKAAQHAVELMNDAGVNLGGSALTQIDLKKQSKFGYGDAGYYYNSYKGYYSDN